MNILVIGQGGREHAIVNELVRSERIHRLYCIPGSDGMSEQVESYLLDVSDQSCWPELLEFCKNKSIDLVVIGPEAPLVMGLASYLRTYDVSVFGTGKKGARLEGSKIFAKEFMQKAGVQTARYKIIENDQMAYEFKEDFNLPYIIKVDGLASGKGVFICKTDQEYQSAVDQIFIQKRFGDKQRAIIEECLNGWELSVHILFDGQNWEMMPYSQDYKRLYEGDLGPNTGGMGTVSPLKIDVDLIEEIKKQVIEKVVQQLISSQIDYRGVLYIGLMITEHGPFVLEFNVRFGDPETQVLFPLLDGDWANALKAVADGNLTQLKWKNNSVACVVLAAPDYPDHPKKGGRIDGDIHSRTSQSYFLHAGTKKVSDGNWKVNGGRVINAIGMGTTLKQALECAYQQAQNITWEGLQMRRDIGRNLPEFTNSNEA